MAGSDVQVDVNTAGPQPSGSLDFADGTLLHHGRAETNRARRFETGLTFLERLADFVTIAITVGLGCYLFPRLGAALSTVELISVASAFALVAVLMLDREGAYRRGNSLLYVKETERVLRVCTQMFILTSAVALFTAPRIISWQLAASAACVMFALLVQKQAVYQLVRGLHAKGVGVRRVVIYGAGYTGRRVFSALARSPKLGLQPVAVIDDNPARGPSIFEAAYRRQRSAPVLQGPITKEVLQNQSAGMLVIAIPSLAREKFVQVLNEATAVGVDVAFVPNHYVPTDLWIEHADVDGLLLASFTGPSERFVYQGCKRVFDFLVGGVLLLLSSPLMLAIAVLIRLGSPGPIIFRQERVGRNSSLFRMYKFRTMFANVCQDEFSPIAADDQRITPIGRFLRRTSLDELPQLLNVVRGEMSLVGPRPEMPFIVKQYLPRYRQRLHVTPGVTGLWQISADRAYLIHENIEYDLYYIRNCTFFMDIAILLHTVFFAMRGI